MGKIARKSALREAALRSGLVTPDQLDQLAARAETDALPCPPGPLSDEELGCRLVDSGVLTRYQVDQLRAGRTKLNLGPYTIVDWIGQGGMGQVFKAVHKVMGRQCAVKVLPKDKSTPETIECFTREIRTQAQLDHPNLVRAYDAGHDGNVHYLVTEYVPGTDLRQLVRRQGPLTMSQAANVIAQAARGLDYAHQRGLIHRDVKPGNILVTPEGIAKVSDLGLSGSAQEAQADPKAGRIVGTADYLSPEQINCPDRVSATSDIYSLGCTLYYAISGKVPFPGGTVRDKARRHCDETPWHPRRFNPEVSEEFVEVIADMMEKDPRQRIPTAADVAARLEPWAREASPLPSQQLTKSPWTPPPLPTGAEDEELPETFDGGNPEDSDSRGSQASQPTFPAASGGQETRRIHRVQPPPLRRSRNRNSSVVRRVTLALALAIPAAMIAGALLAFAVMSLLR